MEKLKVFISYAHDDEKGKEKFHQHFATWENKELIEVWHDRKIDPGDDWNNEIKENLEEANVIIMLLSPSFFASNYIQKVEFKCALERHLGGSALAIGVVLKPCSWNNTEISKFQLLPQDAKAIMLRKGAKRDAVFNQVAEKVMGLVDRFLRDKNEKDEQVPNEGSAERILSYSIPIPWEKEVNIDKEFYLKTLPYFAEQLYIFTERSVNSINAFRKGYEKHRKTAQSMNDLDKLKGFLQSLCRDVNVLFFKWGGVRTHFRCLDIERNKYLRLAIAFSDEINDNYALTPIPKDEDQFSMIHKSAELKTPLIYSVNKEEKDWHSGYDLAKREFKDYVTFALLDDVFRYKDKHLLSMGISFANPEMQRNLSYILTLCRFDVIISKVIKSFADAQNIDITDTLLEYNNSMSHDAK